jgi:hypothetical protein
MATKTHHHRTAIAPYRHPSPPRTIVVRAAAPATRHKGKKHHGSRKMSSEKVLMGLAMGGLAMGFLDKPGGPASNLPTIPLLGKAGTIALVAHFMAKGKLGIITDVRNAAAVVAAYEFGLKGSVSGDED